MIEMAEIDYGHQMNPWARPNHREYLEYKRDIVEEAEKSAVEEGD